MMEAICFSETSVLTRATWRNISVVAILLLKRGLLQTVNSWHRVRIRSAPSNDLRQELLASAACQRSKCELLWEEDVTWSRQQIPTAVNLSFLEHSCFFIQVAPQLSSQGSVDPVPDPLLLRKSGRIGNPTRDLYLQPGTLTTRPQRWSIYGNRHSKIVQFQAEIICLVFTVTTITNRP
jgi:hypothetical protein